MKNFNKNRGMLPALLFGLALLIAGCGGGGGNDSSSSAGRNRAQDATTTGAASGASAAAVASAAPNMMPIVVEAGPANTVNVPFTSVTVCTPGNAAQCQTIDHVIVDTGSSGLRLFSALLSPSLSLPQVTTAAGAALAECTQFADGATWGPIRIADVQLAGQRASSLPIQIMGDPGFAPVPSGCANTGRINNTVQSFGANGILGVGPFLQDCGIGCERVAENGIYYGCVATVCQLTIAPVAQQVQHPVSFFANDNNGVLITLPSVPPSGAATASGSLIFGIGTQANNMLGAASVFTISADRGTFSTVYKGKTYSKSFIDSGSNGIFFSDDSIPVCNLGFYCPPLPLTLSATNLGLSGATNAVNFVVANSNSLFLQNSGLTASSALAGPAPASDIFDWGLSFFFGRTVFTAIEGKATPGGTGPYFAY